MKKVLGIFALAVSLLLTTGMASASTTFSTSVNTNGNLDVYDYGQNANFQNDISIGQGSLDLDQVGNGNTGFFNDVDMNDGNVDIDQSGQENSAMSNDVDLNSGTMNFEQDIDTNYGHFSNDVRLRESDVRFENSAGEGQIAGHWSGTGDGWVTSHKQISFDQELYVGESNDNGDEAKSTQYFTKESDSDYIAQEVQVNPTGHSWEAEPDELDMMYGNDGQGGVMNQINDPTYGGRASLSQDGRMRGDYNFGKQWTNTDGGSGSSFTEYDSDDWVNFDQSMTFE